MQISAFKRLVALCMFVGLTACTISPAVRAAEPAYALQTAKTKTIQGVYEFEIETKHLTAKEWIVYAAKIPELPSQTGVQTALAPVGKAYRELSDRHRTLLQARVPADTAALKHKFRGRIECQATLHSRQLVRRAAGEKYAKPVEPDTAERAASLAETTTLDFTNDKFQAWLKKKGLHRRASEDDLAFGRRAFLAITRSMTYEYNDVMDRHASHLCEVDKADCGGMSVLFVAAMRANRIPARVLAGRWAKSSIAGATLDGVSYQQQHIKAEFFVHDVGWVPVDLSSAVEHDKSPEGLRYFGYDGGNFLVVHLDPDVKLDSVYFGVKSMPLLQSFHYYVTGQGKLDDAKLTREWIVETLTK